MAKIYLFDTSILIKYFRDQDDLATDWVERAIRRSIVAGVSIITVVELWVGVRDEAKERDTKILLSCFRIFELNRKIAQRAGKLWQPFYRDITDKKYLADILIAATAEYFKADIVTLNEKHFKGLPLKDVQVINIHPND